LPLDTLGAQTQGIIGYWLAQELANAGVTAPIAVVLTQTLVDPDDPAFATPTKLIGPSYTRAQAVAFATNSGRPAVIGSLAEAAYVLSGTSGTTIIADAIPARSQPA